MKKENVINFGCRLNAYESEIIKNILKRKNLKNVIVFNTCCVTDEAEKQTVQAIRRHKRENPDIEIIVTGCAAQINPRKYSEMSEVARVISNKYKLLAKSYFSQKENEERNKQRVNSNGTLEPRFREDDACNKIPSSSSSRMRGSRGCGGVKPDKLEQVKKGQEETELISSLEGKTRALVPIQNGCDNRCTFCIVPYTRGSSVSTPLEKILEQVKVFVKQGYKEVVLTGINITSYGKDLNEKINLASVVKKILKENPALARLRLSSIDIADIDDDLFEIITTEKRFMPHLHLSLQSGDNQILHKMKRRHTREQVQKFYRNVQAARANITFGADIITGFPTETEEQFENTRMLIEEIKIPFLHVFPYSERYNTIAARMPQLDKKIRKDRAKVLREIGKKNLEELSKKFVGQEVEILLEKNNVGRMENFLKVTVVSNNFDAGEIIRVKVTEYKNGNLIGEIIK